MLQLLAIMKSPTFQFDPKSHSKLKGNDEISMSLGIQLALTVCVSGEVLCVFACVFSVFSCNGCAHVRLPPPQPPPAEAAAASPKRVTRAASSERG